jgi:spore coat protein U-like protein
MKRRTHLLISICVALGILRAGTALGAGFCNITSAGVSFGSYDVFASTENDQTGTVSIACGGNITTAATLTVSLDKGANSSGLPNRNMKLASGSDLLSYNLYFDAARTQVWGDGTGGTVIWSTVGGHNPTPTHTVFGKIPASQTSVSVGSYSDTVTMTLNF